MNTLNIKTMREMYKLHPTSELKLIKSNERWMVGLEYKQNNYLLADRDNLVRKWVDADRAINYMHEKLDAKTARINIQEEMNK